MTGYMVNETNVRHLLPETLWLEPEHYQRAQELSAGIGSEQQQWQAYLAFLGQLTFADWLRERLPHLPIHNHPYETPSNEIPEIAALRIGAFKLCCIAVEQVFDEVVSIPKVAIAQPELAAHFYIVLEVLEDQEQVIIRGFLRHDELFAYSLSETLPDNRFCSVSLTTFDSEINHLVLYTQQIDPSAIPLPAAFAEQPEVNPQQDFSELRTRLSQWLEGILHEGWHTLDTLINPASNLAWNTRHTSLNTRGGKLINFGLQLKHQAVVLLVTVTPESEGKIGINMQVLPAGGAQVLPPHLKLILLSSTDDRLLQEVESREQDNYIQLKPFKGKPGTRFSIEVSLNNIRVREAFEL